VAVPEGYNPTTVMNYALTVNAGDQALLDFGAQVSAQAVPLLRQRVGIRRCWG